jgi:DNA-binding LacI/PurR family transcriptional regulator
MRIIEQHICEIDLDDEEFENRSLAWLIRDMIDGFITSKNMVLLDQLYQWKNNIYVVVLNEYERE